MRLWSLHPRYLDAQGLVALWREGLLAQKVLAGKTRGYRHHPQLLRFQDSSSRVVMINLYLHVICDEADRRGYDFDRSKLLPLSAPKGARRLTMTVTRGQIEFEWQHLLKKLYKRSRQQYLKIKCIRRPRPHPLFRVVHGCIEKWERVV